MLDINTILLTIIVGGALIMCGVLFSRNYWLKQNVKWLALNGYLPTIVKINSDGEKTGVIVTVNAYIDYLKQLYEIQHPKESDENRNDDSSPSSEE